MSLIGKTSANLAVAITGQDLASPTFAKVVSDLKKIHKESGNTGTALSRMGTVLKGAALGAAAAAGTMAIKLGVDGVKSAMDEEQALIKLHTALNNVGQGFAQTQVDDFINKLMFATGVADDKLRPAFQTLVTATQDATQAQSLLQLALDISTAKGQDLGTVSMALAKASNGSTGALTRLGVPLSENAKKAGNFQVAVSELSTAFAGQAAAAADTFAGRMQRVSVAFSELQESFGTGFLNGLVDSQGATDNLTASLVDAQAQAESLGKSLGGLVNSLGAVADIYGSIPEWMRTSPLTFVRDAWNALHQDTSSTADATARSAGRIEDSIYNMSQKAQQDLYRASHAGEVFAKTLSDAERTYVARYQLVITTKMQQETAAQRWAQGMTADQFDQSKWTDYGSSTTRSGSSSGGSGGSSSSGGQTPEQKRAEARRQMISTLRDSLAGFGKISTFDQAAYGAAKDTLDQANRAVKDATNQVAKAKADLLGIGPGNDVETMRKRAEARQRLADAEFALADARMKQGTAEKAKADSEVTGKNLLKSTQERLRRIQRFGQVLTRLDRLRLSPTLLQEIASAGPEDGLALGQALLEQPGVIKGLNAAYKGIDKASGRIATYVADDRFNPSANQINSRNARSAASDIQPVEVTLKLDSQVVAKQLVRLRRRNGGAPLGIG